jgi:hypothetical protein
MSIDLVTQFSLIDSVIAWLEQDQAVIALFGDTWNQAPQTGMAKFFADVVDQVPLPYCLIQEIGETYQFQTMSGIPGTQTHPFVAPGKMLFRIFADSREGTRQLGFAVARSLNDAPLAWPGESNEMVFRMGQSRFVPLSQPSGPNVPVIFCREFIFDYEYSASLEDFT